VVPATNQLFALTLVVSAQIKFHHFDGVAVIEKERIKSKGNNEF